MEGVTLPIDLDFKLASGNAGDFDKATKGIEAGVIRLQERINKIMSKLSLTPQTAQTTKYMATLQKSIASVSKAYEKFQTEMTKTAVSSEIYQDAINNLEAYEEELKTVEGSISNYRVNLATDPGSEQITRRLDKEIAKRKELKSLIRDYREILANPASAALTAEDNQVELLNAHFEQLKNLIREIDTGLSQPIKSSQYQILETEANKLLEKLQAYNEKSKEMETRSQYGIKSSGKSWIELQLEVKKTSSELDAVLRKMRELTKSGGAFTSGGTVDAIKELQARLKSINQSRINIAGAGQRMGTVETRAPIRLSDINAGTASLDQFDASAKNATDSLQRLSTVSNALNRMTKLIRTAAKGMANLAKNVLTLGLASKKASHHSRGLFKQLKRTILMYGLGFRTAYYAIRRLRKVFIEGLTEMAKSSDMMNKQLSSFKMALNTVKGSIATAFQPIVSAVLPALTTMANHLTHLLELIAKFNAVLTGQNYILKANAKSIDVAADAQKNANKTNKDALGTYDKLEVINKNTDSDSENGSDLGVTYSKENVGGAVSRFAKMVKEAWQNSDFTEVGRTISNKFVSALQSIKWADIKSGAEKLAHSVASLINGFFESENLGKTIGDTLSNALLTGIAFMFTASNEIKFDDIGKNIKAAINTFLTNMAKVDESGLSGWGKLGRSLSNLANGMLTMLNTALDDKESWQRVGQGIADFISGIEWGKLIWNFTSLVTNIIKGIASAILGYAGENPISAAIITFIATTVGIAFVSSSILSKIVEVGKFVKELKGLGGGTSSIADTSTTMESAGQTVDNVSTGTSKLTGKLTSLVKNLGLGIVIIAEVAVAAGLFVAAIWGIGVLLEQVGKAWEPVIKNGTTILTAMGIGTGILVGIGVATALLGSAGWALAGEIGLGILMLVELGVAAGLFIAEIWAIGWGLDKIRQAWEPVLQNGDTIIKAIEYGTVILIAVGGVCALLGAAAVASVGLLPLAIALGTAMLVELTGAFKEFCDSLISVAKKLQKLAPELSKLNEILPGLRDDMKSFTSFMKDFAGEIVNYTKSNVISGIATTIDKFIGFFTTDPMKKLNNDLTKRTTQFKTLVTTLEKLNPIIQKATKLVGVYNSSMGSFEKAAGGKGTLLGSIADGAKNVVNGVKNMFEGMVNAVIKGINFLVRALNKVSINIPSWVPSIGGKTFGFKIKEISTVNIPGLAKGTVVPPNKEFLSVLGDNKQEPEIVSPLSTMKQALAEVLAEFGGVQKIPDVNLLLDRVTIARAVWDESEKRYKQTGKSPI